MMAKMQDQLQWRADLLISGHFGELADQFSFPLTMHTDGGTRIVQDRRQMPALLEKTRDDWKSRGVNRIRVEVLAVSEVRHGRFHVRSTYHELGGTGWLLGQINSVQYYMQTAKGLRIVMTESTRKSATATWPQDRGHDAPGP